MNFEELMGKFCIYNKNTDCYYCKEGKMWNPQLENATIACNALELIKLIDGFSGNKENYILFLDSYIFQFAGEEIIKMKIKDFIEINKKSLIKFTMENRKKVLMLNRWKG